MRNDADWSNQKSAWPLSFRITATICHNRQSGKMQTRNAENGCCWRLDRAPCKRALQYIVDSCEDETRVQCLCEMCRNEMTDMAGGTCNVVHDYCTISLRLFLECQTVVTDLARLTCHCGSATGSSWTSATETADVTDADAVAGMQDAPKSNAAGKILYLWNCSRFFHQIYSIYR